MTETTSRRINRQLLTMSEENAVFQPDQTGSSLAEDDFAQQNGGTEEAQMSSTGATGGTGAFNPVSNPMPPSICPQLYVCPLNYLIRQPSCISSLPAES